MNEPVVAPEVRCAGEFRMIMYRGTSSSAHRKLNAEFASDPGDYGRGEYWSGCSDFPEQYGEVEVKEIHLHYALHLSSEDICQLARDYGTTIVQHGHAKRLEAAERLTNDMRDRGYDGIVVCGYETFNLWSACVFSNEEESVSAA